MHVNYLWYRTYKMPCVIVYILQRHCVKAVAITEACYFNSNKVNSTIFNIYLWYGVYIYIGI